MARPEEITAELLKLKEIVSNLNGWLNIENLTYQMIKADCSDLILKKQRSMNELDQIIAAKADAIKENERIVQEGRDKVAKMTELVEANMIATAKEREIAAEERKKAELLKYQAIKDADRFATELEAKKAAIVAPVIEQPTVPEKEPVPHRTNRK